MADTKITALAAIGANPINVATFPIPMVDLLDTSMAASGTTKKVTVNQILGAGGTATLASATITGAATVGTTLGVTGASTLASVGVTGAATVGTTLGVTGVSTLTGNVGIGTAPDSKLRVLDAAGNGMRIGFSSGSANLNLFDATSHQFRPLSGSGTNFGEVNVNGIGIARAPSASGIGIAFPATQSASSDANTLDDYEEGTWSPTVGTNVNLTSVTAVSALYTKVGRLVTITGSVTATVTLPNILTYFTLLTLPFANNGTTTGAVQENGNLTIGAIQVASSNLYGFFPAASAIVSGAATFNYSVTYTV